MLLPQPGEFLLVVCGGGPSAKVSFKQVRFGDMPGDLASQSTRTMLLSRKKSKICPGSQHGAFAEREED